MNDKTIIIFYSYTGHTKYIANLISEKLHCEVLELKPTIPYSTDYNSVVDEYQNNEHAKSTPTLELLDIDLAKYDNIILGTPVWWYTITPPVRTFLKENDLKGKTIIPFATNAGWLGRTFKEIKELCPDSRIENEMNIEFTGDYKVTELVTEMSEIESWIEEIAKKI